MPRPLLLTAIALLAGAGPALAQSSGPCTDAALALERFTGQMTAAEFEAEADWLQGRIDGRPKGHDPCRLVDEAHAGLDSLLATDVAAPEQATAPTGTPTAAPVPAASRAHRIDLVFDAPITGAYSARVVRAAPWLDVDAVSEHAQAGAGRRLPVPFRVAADAVVGEVGEVVFEVVGPSGQVVGVAEVAVSVAPPRAFALGAGFPNPTAHAVTHRYALPFDSDVVAEVYDALGRRVLRLDLGRQRAGGREHVLETRALSPGVYLYRLTARTTAGDVEVAGRLVTVAR